MNCRDTIQNSLDYIESNIMAPISAEELAKQAGFSLFHYYRLFQAAIGVPVMQYILRRRLLHAIYEIYCGSSSVDAALKYGFGTYAGFYKAFRREFGCTPAMFLKECRARRPYRIDLNKEEHMIVTHKKATQILKYWNLENEVISDIYYGGTGSKNDNAYYVGEKYVLKFTTNFGRLKNNIELSRSIDSVGLCVALPVVTVDGREYIQDGELYFYVTKRLPGCRMVASDIYEGDYTENARFVGKMIGRLHLALQKAEECVNDTSILETVQNWALPNARNVLKLHDDFCREYLAAFRVLYEKLPRQIIHRDPNPGNIIRMDDKCGFIDFELSERNVRIYDPCYAATAILSESFGKDNGKWLEICRSIIIGYDSIVGLTPDERKAVPYMILANQFICIAWFCGQEKYADLFETNKRMTEWLLGVFDELTI